MNKATEIAVGAAAGAGTAEILNLLKFLYAEAKLVLDFKYVSDDLATTMEDLRPIIQKIDSMQNLGDLETLKQTVVEARALVAKCSGVEGWEVHKKYSYTKEVCEIQKEMVSFCQVQLQLIQHKNHLESMKEIKQKLNLLTEKIDSNYLSFINMLDHLIQEMYKNHQEVTGKVDSVSQKMDDNHQIVVAKIDHLISPPIFRPLCSVPKLAKAPVGFDWIIRDLKKQLLGDSVKCLVVSGDSGRGKTTLVTHLCHDARIKGKFKHIFFNVVPRTPNIRELVQNLYQHNGHAPPTFDDDDQAISGLQELLKKLREDGPILMVLDDVWPGAESLLEKFKAIDLHGYKILVTSQFKFPSFGSNYELGPLDDEAARTLLIRWAPRPPNASKAEYEDLLIKILECCEGLPIAIEVLGKLFEGQSLNTWKDKVESLSKEETGLDNPHQIVLKCLQPSFNALESTLKECFLDTGSFLQPQKKIYASVIIDIWVELYGKGSSSSVYMKYLKDLASKNLLKLIPLGGKEPEDGFYNEFLVSQHDIVRELAIRQSELEAIMERKVPNLERREENLPVWFPSELEAYVERKRLNLEIKEDNIPDWSQSKLEAIRQSELEEILERKRLNLEIRGNKFPDWCLDLKKPVNARLLSISTDDLFSSNWVEMEFPNVEAIVLNISSSNYALPSFIETAEKLKVVIIINHGFYLSRLSNFPYLSSLPNLKRIRLEKVSITFLDILRLQLSSLKKFSLVMCWFGKVSHDTKEIIDASKALPNLEEIDIDYCYDLVELPSWISQVVSLKTLSITNCNKLSKLPEAIGNLRNLETLRLSSCNSLFELPETVERLSSLPNLKRIRLEKVSITFLDILRLQCSNLKKFSLVLCRFGEVSHDTKEIDVSKALPSLEEIDIDYCYDLVELPSWICEVVSLKALSISNCNKLSKLPEAIGNLSKLEVLRLRSCICLSELPQTTERLNNLLLLDISGCFQLKKFPLEIGNLQNLKKISMRDCYRSELPDSVKNLEGLEVKCDEGTVFVWKRFEQKMKNLTIIVEETEHNLNFLQQISEESRESCGELL